MEGYKAKLLMHLKIVFFLALLLVPILLILEIVYPPILNYKNPLFLLVFFVLAEFFVLILSIYFQWRGGKPLFGTARYYLAMGFIAVLVFFILLFPVIGNSGSSIITAVEIPFFYAGTILLLELIYYILASLVGTKSWYD